MKKGSGLADWEKFSRLFEPILQSCKQQLGHTPKHRELRLLGYGRFVSACFHHHGGYAEVLRRLGDNPAKRVRAAGPVRARERQQVKDQRFREKLGQLFPSYLRLGIAPSSSAVYLQDKRLRHQMLKSHDGYKGTCSRLGLLPFSLGRKLWSQTTAIIEAWAFVRQHGEWPTARACSSSLRHLRFQRAKLTWYRSFMVPHMTPGMASYVLEQGELHAAWLRQHRPQLSSAHHRYLQWLRSRSSA